MSAGIAPRAIVAIAVSAALHLGAVFAVAGWISTTAIVQTSDAELGHQSTLLVRLNDKAGELGPRLNPGRVELGAQNPGALGRQQRIDNQANRSIKVPALLHGEPFFQSKELTEPAVVQSEPELLDLTLHNPNIQGKVILRLWVDANGQVIHHAVEYSNVPDSTLDMTLRAFATTKFVPGHIAGIPTGNIKRVEIVFGETLSTNVGD